MSAKTASLPSEGARASTHEGDSGTNVENARLRKQNEALTRQLNVIDRVARRIATPQEMDDVLRTITREAVGFLHAAGGGIYLLTKGDEHVELRAGVGLPAGMDGALLNKNEGVVGHVLKTNQLFSVPNYRQWDGRRKNLDALNLTSVIGVPITSSRGEQLGVLAAHHNSAQKEFDPFDKDTFLRYGRHAGVAIGNAMRLDERTQLLKERGAMDSITQALVSLLDYNQLVRKVFELLHEQFKYPAIAVLLRSPEKENELYIERALNYPDEVQKKFRIKIASRRSVVALVARTGEAIIVPDVSKEPRYVPGIPGGRSEIAVPLIHEGEVIGVLDVESREPDAFGEHDRWFLTQIASAFSIAIYNAQQFEVAAHKEFLAEVSGAVVGAPNLDAGLHIVAERMLEVCPARFCLMMWLTRDGKHLRVRAAVSEPGKKGQRRTKLHWKPVLNGMCEMLSVPHLARLVHRVNGVILKSGDPLAERFLRDCARHVALQENLEAALLIPLRVDTGLIGLCLLGQTSEGRRGGFAEAEKRVAIQLAKHASDALEKARELELEQEQKQLWYRLHELGTEVKSKGGLDEMLDLIVKSAKQLLNAEVCTLFLVRQKGFLSLEANCGSPKLSYRKGIPIEIKKGKGAGLTGHIAAQGKLFNAHGEELLSHPAIKKHGPQRHIPS
jgi:GAF domain-containing protein